MGNYNLYFSEEDNKKLVLAETTTIWDFCKKVVFEEGTSYSKIEKKLGWIRAQRDFSWRPKTADSRRRKNCTFIELEIPRGSFVWYKDKNNQLQKFEVVSYNKILGLKGEKTNLSPFVNNIRKGKSNYSQNTQMDGFDSFYYPKEDSGELETLNNRRYRLEKEKAAK